jgi:hypothetical protein
LAQLLNVKSQQLEDVADPQGAILLGTHAPKRDDVFTIINPEDNGVYEVDGASLRDVLNSGAILETAPEKKHRELQEKYGSVGGMAASAAAGAARGLTFGASDVVGAAVGLGETLEGLKTTNPGSSIMGEIGGIVVPTLLTGGTGIVAKGAQGALKGVKAVSSISAKAGERIAAKIGLEAGEGIAGKIAGAAPKVLGSAIEGATYGLGQSVSEASLGEPTNIAENLLIGGAFGSALPLIGMAGKELVEEGLPTLAALTSGAPRSELTKFYEMSGAGKNVRQLIKGGPDVIKQRIVEIARENENLAKTANAMFKDTKFAKADDLLAHVSPADVAQKTGGFEALKQQFADMRATVAADPNRYSSSVVSQLAEIEQDYLRKLGQATTASDGFKALDELKNRLYDTSVVAKKAQTVESIASSKLAKDLRDSASALLQDESVWGKTATMQTKMNSALKEFEDAREAFNKAFTVKTRNGPRVAAKKILSYAKNEGTVESSDLAAALDNYIARSNDLRAVVAQNGGKVAEKIGAMKSAKGKLENSLEELEIWRAYDSLGGGQNRDTFGNKLTYNLSMLNPAGKFAVSVMGFAERQLAKTNNQWLKDVGAAVSALSTKVPAKAALTLKSALDAKKSAREVQRLASDPMAMAAYSRQMTGQLQLAAPKAAQAAQDKLSETVQFLAQRAPANPNQGLAGLDDDWEPSDAQTASWSRYLAAAQEPSILLKEFANGSLAPETVETVKALYPNYYEKSVGAVAQYIAEKKPKVTYARRLQLSMLLQRPVEPALQPATMASLQGNYAQQQQVQQSQAVKPLSPDFAASNLSSGQKLLTR